jgi:hypothetical protein
VSWQLQFNDTLGDSIPGSQARSRAGRTRSGLRFAQRDAGGGTRVSLGNGRRSRPIERPGESPRAAERWAGGDLAWLDAGGGAASGRVVTDPPPGGAAPRDSGRRKGGA